MRDYLEKLAAKSAPRDWSAGFVQDLIDGAKQNGFGRSVSVEMFDGTKLAAAKFALDEHTLHTILELGGLGMLAVPAVHHLATTKPEDHTGKIMAGTEIAGLGTLAIPQIMNLLKK